MAIDLSKISKEDLDQLIKEEALKMRAEMLSNSKKKANINRLQETKKLLEQELGELEMSGTDIEEGIFGKMFGGGGDKRSQVIKDLLNHPNKGPELLLYASPAQLEQFKQIAPDRAGAIDRFVASMGANKQSDENRANSYIDFFVSGKGKYVRWNPEAKAYQDAGSVAGNVASSFAEGESTSPL